MTSTSMTAQIFPKYCLGVLITIFYRAWILMIGAGVVHAEVADSIAAISYGIALLLALLWTLFKWFITLHEGLHLNVDPT